MKRKNGDFDRRNWLAITHAHPLFFVSVAAKGLRDRTSLLFSTLARRSISVASKGLMKARCWRESNGLGWEDFGGVIRTAGREFMVRAARRKCADSMGEIISYRYQLSNDYL